MDEEEIIDEDKKAYLASLNGWTDSATDLIIRKETAYELKRIADALEEGIVTWKPST
jgi:hypothetical protein